MDRRTLLKTALGAALTAYRPFARAGNARVLIIGGGWGGLAAARALRQLAPSLDVTLLARDSHFTSFPLSNRWLCGLLPQPPIRAAYADIARHLGYRFLQTEVAAVAREKRQISASSGPLPYDWLVIAAGIRENHGAWFGDDIELARLTREKFASGHVDPAGLPALRQKLAGFNGGTLVLTIPPAPYRCPPAPYERALMIAETLRQRQLKARLVILDPNLPMLAFDRVYRDAYRDWITYLPQATIRHVDPLARRIQTEFDTVNFTDALLAPPQQAADLLWKSDLIGHNSDGSPSGWAAHDPTHLHAIGDPNVFLIGDQLDRSSTLFGFYPKTGQIAARQGQIVAREIAARAAGETPPRLLPDSSCQVITRVSPREMTRIDTSYRFRGDGLIQQTVRQQHIPQAADEDIAWAQAMYAELGIPSD